MLADNITLPVDVANNGTTVDQLYVRDVVNNEKGLSIYKGSAHSFTDEDLIIFRRTLPTKVGNFYGVVKADTKLRQSVSVLGADGETSYAQVGIIDIHSSLPVGASPAFALELRQRAIALIDHQLFGDVVENGDY